MWTTMIDPQMDAVVGAGNVNAQNAYNFNSSPEIFRSSFYGETIDDIEHPAWASSISFSESCGSCLSKISSLCADSKNQNYSDMSDIRNVPNDDYAEIHFGDGSSLPQPSGVPSIEPQMTEEGNSLRNCSKNPILSEFNENFAQTNASGSVQSLASSSRTVYASPRPNSENQFYYPLNKTLLSEKAMKRRGSLYRERAPSENDLDFHHKEYLSLSKLSHSLHDVSSIPSNGLKKPSRKSLNAGISSSALYSRNRSRDSGFIFSESLLSLSSGGRNYDHVESKVKQYIQNIKDADAIRRKQRADSKVLSTNSSPKQQLEHEDEGNKVDSHLMDVVQKLQSDIQARDDHILKLREDYSHLLSKYAEAENKLDRLRFGCPENTAQESRANKAKSQLWKYSHPSPVYKPLVSTESQHLNPAEDDTCSLTSSKFLSNLESPDSSQCMKEASQKKKKKGEVVISAPLRPISSLYCTSVRLDRVVCPLTPKPSFGISPLSSSYGEHKSIASHVTKRTDIVDSRTLDDTLKEGTTDTGIDDCRPITGRNQVSRQMSLKAEPIRHLPHEDPIVKVQRWQKSILSDSHPEFSSCSGKSSSNGMLVSDHWQPANYQEPQRSSCNSSPKKQSIGVQANLDESGTFPSLSSKLSISMVPRLNLEGLSACTGETSESLFSTHLVAPTQLSLESDPNLSENSQLLSNVNFSLPSSNNENETCHLKRHLCEGKCEVCGCIIKSNLLQSDNSEELRGAGFSSKGEKTCSIGSIDKSFSKCKKGKPEETTSHINGAELAKVISMCLKDQDHVVPGTPEESKSFKQAFQQLESKMNSLKCSLDLQTFVNVLDLFLEKIISKRCECHSNHHSPVNSNSEGRMSAHVSSEVSADFIENVSLLQCLEEMDDYTNQVWAKTESFLEVLDAKRLLKAE